MADKRLVETGDHRLTEAGDFRLVDGEPTALLLEDGTPLLLEDGTELLLESPAGATYEYTASGGITFAGAAPTEFHQAVHEYVASGGIVFGGAATTLYDPSLVGAYTGSGGISFGGAAPTSFEAAPEPAVYEYQAAGGISFGGSAGLAFVVTSIVTPDDALTDDDLISFRWDAGDAQIINRVVAEFDYDSDTGVYTKILIFSHDVSVARYGPRPALHIQSQGLRTALGADAFLTARAEEVFRRFADIPPAILQVEVFYRRHAWEAGDIVSLSSAFIPNLQISGRGIAEVPFELVDIRPQFAQRGKIIASLMTVGTE